MTRRSGPAALILAAVLTLTAVTLAGCTTSGGSAGVPDVAAGDTATSDSAASDLATTESAATTDPTRSVISTATLQVTVDDPIGAADATVTLVTRAGGRVDSRSETPAVDGLGRSASLVVRVPAAGLADFLAAVKDLGENEFEMISSTDVTAETLDLGARVSALTASVDRLTTLLASASDTGDLIEIETALSSRQADLESLQAQQRALDDQVALATASIDLGSVEAAPVDEPRDFFSGIATGFDAVTAFLGSLAIAAGVALPWLVIPVLAATVVVVVLRRRATAASEAPARATME